MVTLTKQPEQAKFFCAKKITSTKKVTGLSRKLGYVQLTMVFGDLLRSTCKWVLFAYCIETIYLTDL